LIGNLTTSCFAKYQLIIDMRKTRKSRNLNFPTREWMH
jgi:hypothetical protein